METVGVRELRQDLSVHLRAIQDGDEPIVAGSDERTRADQACSRLDLLPISRSILDRATPRPPPELRSLDAIHLATVLEPRTPPVVVAHDARLLRAAREQGRATVLPGRGQQRAGP